MIYLMRGSLLDTEIACCETLDRAWALQAHGWRQVSRDRYMAAWRRLDAMRICELRRAAQGERLDERVVGEDIWQ